MRNCLRSSLTALVLAGLALPSCAIDETSNPTQRCETTADCEGGRTCYRNYCIVGGTLDGGEMDAGDAGRDTAGCVPTGDEMCNGLDDDCNGTTDDIESVTCTNGEEGLCATAHLVCPSDGGATPVCRRDAPPVAETCNGMDDDCDGTTDEQSARRCYPDDAMGCTLVAGRYVCRGACGAGVQSCVDGAYGACEQARTPGTEVCTTGADVAGDENCDDMIDEDCTCTAGTPCFPGDVRQAGLGECDVGTLNCATNTCTGFGMPSDETCGNEGADNDCDGVEDNVPGTGEVCLDDEMLGVCRTGVTQCGAGGAVECATPMTMLELCDGTDDDCDGMTDEPFDVMTDEANCGGCGNVCDAGLSCCGGECVDATSSDEFCSATAGTCGAECDGTTCCGGGCADTDTDAMNCGACGNACDTGDICCGGECLDDDYDEANCGGCGITCSDGANPDCCTGTCSPDASCDITPAICTGMGLEFCDGACVDDDTDENNCGACGTTCDAGDVCCGGTCVDSDPTHCGGACTDCGSDLCCNGACTTSTASNCTSCGLTCASGTACCGSGCSSLATDSSNCGTCGNACAGGQACSVGHCCDTGSAWCGSACLNIQTDRANCGACGNRCSNGVLGIGYERCVAGTCMI
jgi:hypothetical protein